MTFIVARRFDAVKSTGSFLVLIMLTGKMVRVRYARDQIVPQYVDAANAQWLQVAEQLLGIFRASNGSTRGQLDEEIDDLFGDLPTPQIHQGLAKLLEDRCEFETQSSVPPDEVREAVFLAAARRRQALLEQLGAPFRATKFWPPSRRR